jgi:nitrite reductase (NO-forming)
MSTPRTTPARGDPPSSPTLLGTCQAKDLVRIGFGVIWLIDAALKWQPGFRHDYMANLMGQAQGQPSWLHGWFQFWINLQHPRPEFFAYTVALVETLIALALIFGFARKLTYISAAVFSLLIWATAEGFGGPYTSGSTDIGTAVVYAVVFMSLLALNYQAGPARFSVDYLIEQRVPWWHRIAEVEGRRRKHASVAQPPVPITRTAAT